MKTHKIESNGKKFIFNVIKNTTSPCPQCGIPACGKEDILWYEFDKKRTAIIFDGGCFNLAWEDFFNKNIKTINYESLPEFMKEWNESRGWEDCWDYNGHELHIDDFLESMELLKNSKTEKWMTKEDIKDMQELAKKAKIKGAKLKIVRG